MKLKIVTSFFKNGKQLIKGVVVKVRRINAMLRLCLKKNPLRKNTLFNVCSLNNDKQKDTIDPTSKI